MPDTPPRPGTPAGTPQSTVGSQAASSPDHTRHPGRNEPDRHDREYCRGVTAISCASAVASPWLATFGRNLRYTQIPDAPGAARHYETTSWHDRARRATGCTH